MAGIYIHIPFCRKACHYCNFHFSTALQGKNDFVQCLLKEMVLQKNYTGLQTIDTIYFGGGTPSLLLLSEMELIIGQLRRQFNISTDAEFTLEANPDDITAVKLNEWKNIGINRLSIGIQSFFEEDLKWMNRAHDAQQAKQCIELAQQAGFFNITIDLIYGTPTLTDERWKKNVHTALQYNIPHLSCYALTVEPRTALYHQIEKKKTSPINPNQQSNQFSLLMHWMQVAGYEHYEISNFSKPGYRSRHNSSYWKGNTYLGLGPSAHSYNGLTRQWNIANNALYIQSLQKNTVPFEIEHLSENEKLNEYIMIGLRTCEGISLEKFIGQFGITAQALLLKQIEKYILLKQVVFKRTSLGVNR